ncbi:MAG: hypothetical protein Q8L86_01630 [Vicinamibacterales bacterium]|nr:hypothetical protein [Vicinamibacterales bacterium]
MPRAVSLAACLFSIALTVACAEPPSKEMNQAQGAIDAARAAGAAVYAADEFTAAVDALARSEEAAALRDYRLALNYAIDSRERAQNAAKLAVEGRALARGAAERAVAEVSALVGRARERLGDPEVTRLPARALAEPVAAIEAAEGSLQEARTALDADAYQKAIDATGGVAARVQAALRAIDLAAAAPAARRPR